MRLIHSQFLLPTLFHLLCPLVNSLHSLPHNFQWFFTFAL